MSPASSPPAHQRRRVIRRVIGAVGLCLIAGMIGVTFIAATPPAALPPPSGRLVDIGDRALHIDCRGKLRPGRPTVIIEAGLGGVVPVYARLLQQLALRGRVCAYDRAGLGWSDDRPGVHDATAAADDLHRLLRHAGEAPPYLLAGHSYAGFITRIYVRRYPGDVVGLALIDPSHPRLAPAVAIAPAEIARGLRLYQALEAAARLHLLRLYNPALAGGWLAALPATDQRTVRRLASRPGYYRASRAELAALRVSARQTAATGDLGELPLLVISAGRRAVKADDSAAAATSARLQREIAQLSRCSRQRIIAGADHMSLVTDATTASRVAGMIDVLATALTHASAATAANVAEDATPAYCR